jgi:homoserine kinase type II
MDATEASDAALREGVRGFLGDGDAASCRFVKATGGVNNRVYLVDRPNGARLVIRVYNNGGNRERVAFEHGILEALRDSSLPFQVPRLLRAPGGATSVPITSMEVGTEACMFEPIPGATARVDSLRTAHSAGAAIARLVQRMAGIVLPPSPNPLFRQVYSACPGRVLAPAEVERIVRGPEFEAVRGEAAYLLAELARVCAVADRQTKLPEQQIHADAHLDNLLADADGEVTGILDFEFSARDWRVMEACVGLTKYVATQGIDIRASIAAFLAGYRAGGGRLTREEAAFVPDGMVLRILSNVVFFAGRATADPPQDNIGTLVNKMVPYAQRCRWIESNRDFLAAETAKLVE